MLPQPQRIWLPESVAYRHLAEVSAVDRRVREYDERLRFGLNEDTGDWCVFMLMPHGTPPRPVLGWREVPTAEAAVERLYRTDAVRHGDAMWHRLQRDAERRQAESEYQASEETGEAAERLEVLLRQLGHHPVPRAFFTGKSEYRG